MLTLILITILIALAFDFMNGMNDAANSIATVVSTRVLSPRGAVIWAAFFNFAAYFLFGLHVANTMGKGIVEPATVNEYMILASMVGALIWVTACTVLGMPISVSHSLIGGLIGAGLASGGADTLVLSSNGSFFSSKIFQVVIFIALAPIIGMVAGYILMVISYWVFKKWHLTRADRFFRFFQLISSASYSLGHGSNDAQKTMGVIALLLYSGRDISFVKHYLFPYDEFTVPFWVVITCYVVMGLGTLIGGWKVIKTLGVGLTHLRPQGGFCAETAGAITLFGTALAGIPVSTTHTITGSIMGVGITKRFSAVRWGVAGNIITAWVLTIPAAALMSGLTYLMISMFL